MGSLSGLEIDGTVHPRVNSADPVPPRPRPAQPPHLLRDDADAIAVATALAQDLAQGAQLRAPEGLLPLDELHRYSQRGLWSILIPKRFGGPGLSHATLARVIAIVATGDPAVAQIAQNHIAITDLIDLDATEEEKAQVFGWSLAGLRFGNAFSEFGSKTVADFQTRVTLRRQRRRGERREVLHHRGAAGAYHSDRRGGR